MEISSLQQEKDRLRKEFASKISPLSEPGKIAQQLRRLPAYRRSKRLFVSPVRELSQIRINCLLDGKELVIPGPGLKDGFYRFLPYSLNFKDIEYAVSVKGLKKFGELLDLSRKYYIDLFLTDGVVLNLEGGRIGDGNGFFDLAFAILTWYCPENRNSKVAMICNEEQVTARPIPRAPWDIDIDFYLSSKKSPEIIPDNKVISPEESGPIFWQQLSSKRIKKVSPLWKIWKNRS